MSPVVSPIVDSNKHLLPNLAIPDSLWLSPAYFAHFWMNNNNNGIVGSPNMVGFVPSPPPNMQSQTPLVHMKMAYEKYLTILGAQNHNGPVVIPAKVQIVTQTAKKASQSKSTTVSKSTDVSKSETKNSNKSFACSECGKVFNAHYNLTRHMPVHTGARPFVCKVNVSWFRGFHFYHASRFKRVFVFRFAEKDFGRQVHCAATKLFTQKKNLINAIFAVKLSIEVQRSILTIGYILEVKIVILVNLIRFNT